MRLKGKRVVLEQRRCYKCNRMWYVPKGDKNTSDIDFGCPYGCDEAGVHHLDFTFVIEKIKEAKQ